MTEKIIKEKVRILMESDIDDEEQLHEMEDNIYEEFVELVAKRGGKLGKLAELVLSTKDLEFERWYS